MRGQCNKYLFDAAQANDVGLGYLSLSPGAASASAAAMQEALPGRNPILRH